MSKPFVSLPLETERDGRALAIQLLEELEAKGAAERCSIEPQHWKWARVKRQQVPPLRYLQILRERNSPEVDRGFCAVLTDFLSSACAGCAPDSVYYTEFLDGLEPPREPEAANG